MVVRLRRSTSRPYYAVGEGQHGVFLSLRTVGEIHGQTEHLEATLRPTAWTWVH